MSAPERVWQCWVGHNGIGWVECAEDHPDAVPYVPESRALAAEQARDEINEARENQRNIIGNLRADLAALRAERDDLMAIVIGDKVRKPSNPDLAAELSALLAARAAVLARMQPQGEVYEVEACDAHGVTADAIVCFRRDEFTPGQRVRVVRIDP